MALVLSVSFFTMDVRRNERMRREKVKQDSIEHVRQAQRVDSMRADSLERARLDSLAKLTAVAVSVEITSAPVSKVLVGDSIQFAAVARDSMDNVLENRVRWRSSDSTVATVDSLTGLVRARKKGKVTVTAKAGDREDHDTMLVNPGSDDRTVAASSGVVRPKPTTSPAIAADATDGAESDTTVEHAFDRTVKRAIERRDTVGIRQSFEASVASEVLAAIHNVPLVAFKVRRRAFNPDYSRKRLSFSMGIYRKTDEPLLPYANFQATVERTANGISIKNIRRE